MKDCTSSYSPYGRHAENLLPAQPLFKFGNNIEKFTIRSQKVFETSVPKPEDPADFIFVSRTVPECPFLDFVHEQDRSLVESVLRITVQEGNEHVHRFRMITKKGDFIEVSMNTAVASNIGCGRGRTICMISASSQRTMATN